MKRERGFTLLEVLVATTLMAIAVVGLLGSLRTSLSTAGRLSDYDRAAVLARRQMEELLASPTLPKGAPFTGLFLPHVTGGVSAGWTATVTPFETMAPPGALPPMGSRVLDRVVLEVWWMQGTRRRTMSLSAYRRDTVKPNELSVYSAFAGEMAQ